MTAPGPGHWVGRRVLVTGGAGFIGSHLVDTIALGAPAVLVVVDSLFLGRRDNLSAAVGVFPDLVIEEVDASDFDQIAAVIDRAQVEVVFDLATVPLPYSLEHPLETIQTNVALAVNLAELARREAFETLVYVSSSEVYGTAQSVPMTEAHLIAPLTPYAASKASADHIVGSYVATFGINATLVRPFNNYGPRQNDAAYAGLVPIVIKKALAGEPVVIFGDGEQTRDFLFVGDTVEGILRAYASPSARGSVFNLASGVESSVNQVVTAIFELLDLPVRIEYADPRPGDVVRHRGSTEKASRDLGFLAATPLRDGLAATVDWYLSGRGRP